MNGVDIALETLLFVLAVVAGVSIFTIGFAVFCIVVDGRRRGDAYERDQRYWKNAQAVNPRYLLGPCDRPGCTKQHGVRLATSAVQSAAHPAKPMTGPSSPKPDAGLWATGRASDPPEPVTPALAGSAAER